MKKTYISMGAIVVMICVTTGVLAGYAVIDQSDHSGNSVNTDWRQICIECAKSNTYACHQSVYEYALAAQWGIDTDCLDLQQNQWVEFAITSNDLAHGTYRLIIVMDVAHFTDHWSFTGGSIDCTIKVDYVEYFDNDPSPSNGPPANSRDVDFNILLPYNEKIKCVPIDFGLVHFQKDWTPFHRIYIQNNEANTILCLDEVILTPA